MPSPAQSEFYVGLLPVEPSVEPPPFRETTLENDQLPNRQPTLRKRASRALARFLIAFCIGVATTLAWQSYGDAAREIIANAHPQLGWLVPQGEPVTQNAADTVTVAGPAAPAFDQQQLNAMSTDIETVRQSIDRIVPGIVAGQEQMARSIDRIAATQEKMARTVDQLTASQEQVMREITKLQAVEQYILYKSSEPPPRPAPAPARNPSPRPSLLPIVR